MSLISRIERMALRTNEIDKLRAIMKAGATVLSQNGFATKLVIAKKKGGKRSTRSAAGAGSPTGKAGRSGKRGKKLRRRSDGSAYLEGDFTEVRDIDFADIDFSDIDFANDGEDEEGGSMAGDVR